MPASTGPEALAAARRETFDSLLIDMVMPGMSGLRSRARAGAGPSADRVIFMSGYHASSPLPYWQFIAKPFDRQILLAKNGRVQPGGAVPPS